METVHTCYPPRGLASFLVLRPWLPALILLLSVLGSPAFKAYAAEIKVTVDFPTDGSRFAKPAPRAIIAGYAQVSGILAPALDLAIAIDRSGSTANPSGGDIDGDGTVGELKRLHFPFRLQDLIQPRSTDPDDSVLAAEVVGSRNLLQFLDPASIRVSVISFGRDLFPAYGYRSLYDHYRDPFYRDPYATPRNPYHDYRNRLYPPMTDVRVEQSLTSDYKKVQEALTWVGVMGPQGATNMAAAIREATADLMGTQTDGAARPGAKKVMLLLTDGFPSFPAGSPNVADPEDTILALRAAYLARQAGVEIHTYALGPKAVGAPFALTEIARITGGRFNPISDPAQIIYRLKEFIFAQLKSLRVENATLDQPAEQVALGPDGAYIAVVPVKPGINQIKVTGLATDGAQAGASVLLNYLSGGEPELVLQPTRREMALRPTPKSFDELKLELEKEKKRWLELNRKTKELELKAKEKGKPQQQLEIDLDVQ